MPTHAVTMLFRGDCYIGLDKSCLLHLQCLVSSLRGLNIVNRCLVSTEVRNNKSDMVLCRFCKSQRVAAADGSRVCGDAARVVPDKQTHLLRCVLLVSRHHRPSDAVLSAGCSQRATGA